MTRSGVSSMKIFTYDEFTGEGPRPPRSARLVASLYWSWSPAHDRVSRLWICTDKSRSAWYLWEESDFYASGELCFWLRAYGSPYKGIDVKEAARELLTATWKHEWELYESPGKGAVVSEPGVLSEAEIRKIEEDAFSGEDSLDTDEA